MARRLSLALPPATRAPGRRRSRGILYPLDVTCVQTGVAAPTAREVRPEDVPPPYHAFLVHERPMTSTLERRCGGRVALRTLATFTRGRAYFRRVLLVEEDSGRPLAMCAIRVVLDAFTPRIRAELLRAALPLGRVLRDADVDYVSRPTAFMTVIPNAEMMRVFWMLEPRALYGRQTEVLVHGEKIGDIVEILPLA